MEIFSTSADHLHRITVAPQSLTLFAPGNPNASARYDVLLHGLDVAAVRNAEEMLLLQYRQVHHATRALAHWMQAGTAERLFVSPFATWGACFIGEIQPAAQAASLFGQDKRESPLAINFDARLQEAEHYYSDHVEKLPPSQPRRTKQADAMGFGSLAFTPTIVAQYGYEFDDTLRFDLVMVPKKDGLSSGLLTISKYWLKYPHKEAMHNQPEDIQNHILWAVLHRFALPQFRQAYERFVALEHALGQISMTPEEMTAVMLDLLDKNRSLSAIENDTVLQQDLRSLIDRMTWYFKPKTQADALLGYLVRYRRLYLDGSENSKEAIQHVLVEPKAYSAISKRLIRDGKLNHSYVREQVAELNNVRILV